MPMSRGAGTEWSPACGVSWQVVQMPMTTGTLKSLLIPPTFLITFEGELLAAKR